MHTPKVRANIETNFFGFITSPQFKNFEPNLWASSGP
jgi:hypothetical protein